MKNSVFLLFVIMLVNSCVFAGENVYVNKKYGIKIEFPDGWFMSDEQQQEQHLKKIYEGQDLDKMREEGKISLVQILASRNKNEDPTVEFLKTLNPYILFGVNNISNKNPTPIEALKSDYQAIKNAGLGRFIEPPQEIVSEGKKGIRAATEYPLYGNISEIVSEYYFVKDNRVYLLSLTCKSEDFPKLKVDFEKVIKSLEIK